MTKSMIYNAYTGIATAVSLFAAHKVLVGAWTTVTGHQPPDASDPTVPAREASAWVLANAAGIGLAGMAASRFVNSRWMKNYNELPTNTKQINIRI